MWVMMVPISSTKCYSCCQSSSKRYSCRQSSTECCSCCQSLTEWCSCCQSSAKCCFCCQWTINVCHAATNLQPNAGVPDANPNETLILLAIYDQYTLVTNNLVVASTELALVVAGLASVVQQVQDSLLSFDQLSTHLIAAKKQKYNINWWFVVDENLYRCVLEFFTSFMLCGSSFFLVFHCKAFGKSSSPSTGFWVGQKFLWSSKILIVIFTSVYWAWQPIILAFHLDWHQAPQHLIKIGISISIWSRIGNSMTKIYWSFIGNKNSRTPPRNDMPACPFRGRGIFGWYWFHWFGGRFHWL